MAKLLSRLPRSCPNECPRSAGPNTGSQLGHGKLTALISGLNQSGLAKQRGRLRIICYLRTFVVPWTLVDSASMPRRSSGGVAAAHAVPTICPQLQIFPVICSDEFWLLGSGLTPRTGPEIEFESHRGHHTAHVSAVRLLLWWLSGAPPNNQQVRGEHRIALRQSGRNRAPVARFMPNASHGGAAF